MGNATLNLSSFHLSDLITLANFLVLCGILRKLSIFTYQHNLMWDDFAKRKGLETRSAKAGGDD